MKSDINNCSFREGLPQEFEIISLARNFKDNPGLLTAPHRTSFFSILWFQKGNPTHMVDFNPVDIKPNTILFLNKAIVQQFDKKGAFDGKAILFSENFFCKTEQDTTFLKSTMLFNDLFWGGQIRLLESNAVFSGLFDQIEVELKNSRDNFQYDILRNLLHNLLLCSERERQKQDFTEIKKSTDLDYVLHFKDILERQYKDQKQVSGFAYALGMTEKRLNQATSKILGKTPKQIIDERIMLEAKRLLVHTNESIKEIGFELGFEEPTNFIKYFKKHHLTTPVEFRYRMTF